MIATPPSALLPRLCTITAYITTVNGKQNIRIDIHALIFLEQTYTRTIQFHFVFYCLHTFLPRFYCFSPTFLTPVQSDPTQIKQNDQDVSSYTP